LAQLLGLEVSVQGHTDLAFREVEHSRWIKFSGNAQRRRRQALVFHGTILHGFNLELIDALLRFPSAQPDYRANRQHTEFVRNIPASADQIRAAIRAAWSASDSPTEIPRERIEQLCREQYDNEEWNLRR
jgi:lipoate-protein ligase A